MKILFTANRFPYPPYRGDKLKIYHLARQLSRHHELYLITFLQDRKDLQHLEELKKYFVWIHLIPLPKYLSLLKVLFGAFGHKPFQVSYFSSKKMEKKIAELHQQKKFDVVHVQHIRMASYWSKYRDVPRILDLPDAYSLYWERRAQTFKGIKKHLAKWEQKRVFAYEKEVLKQYNLTLVCSREDATYLEEKHGLDNVALLPNGVDTTTFSGKSHDYSLDKVILFTGNMDYAPNVDAVLYFSKEIFPEIKKQIPEITFIIAGQRPVKRVENLSDENIIVTGFVEDFGALYRQTALVVAPLRFGAGTQNKVLEAMAMGVPVVSGEVGFYGLNVQSGEGVILAKDKVSFIQSCLQLLQDAHLRKQTGLSGKAVVQKQFSWQVVSKNLEADFKKVIKEVSGNVEEKKKSNRDK